MTTLEKVRIAVAESLGLKVAEVLPEDSFVKLDVDSIEKLQLLLDLEDALGFLIPEDDFKKMITVRDVADYADQRSHRS